MARWTIAMVFALQARLVIILSHWCWIAPQVNSLTLGSGSCFTPRYDCRTGSDCAPEFALRLGTCLRVYYLYLTGEPELQAHLRFKYDLQEALQVSATP